jgi:chlorophyll synthase
MTAQGLAPDWRVLVAAALYSAGAHGIMTLNDFKSIEGDRRMGIGSLPARLGPERAGLVACVFMTVPQIIVIGCLIAWARPWHAAIVGALTLAQIVLMVRLLQAPRERAPWYNATGVTLYVLGMLATAFALGGIARGGV